MCQELATPDQRYPKGTPLGGSRRTRREERGLGCGPAGEAEAVQRMGEGGHGGGQAAAPPLSAHLPASPQVAGAPFPTCDDLQPLLCRLRAGALSVRKQ